jgi:hypothetical protein
MPELVLTLEAMHRTEKRKQKFLAALQGIDIDEEDSGQSNSSNKNVPTAEDIKARAVARLTGDESLAGAIAEGFTSDKGLEYKIMGGTEIG